MSSRSPYRPRRPDTRVRATTLDVGDVLLDRAALNDDHPWLVIARDDWNLTLRNCTSNLNSSLDLVKVVIADKTGDPRWAGKDSYVVKSGYAVDLPTYRDDSYADPSGAMDQYEECVNVVRQEIGPYGPYLVYDQQPVLNWYPRMIERYSELKYNKVGGVTKARMATLLTELA